MDAILFVGALWAEMQLGVSAVVRNSKRLPMSDPNIFHKTRGDQTDAAANRATRARAVRTAVLVLGSTAIWGVMAFVLISDTATAMLATILIGLATLTVRLLGTD